MTTGTTRVLRSSAGIAAAMATMNVTTYGFQMVAARLLGPAAYGAIASLMALMMVLAVLQLGLQATAARRISSTPRNVAQIEGVILATTYRTALGLGALMLIAAPAVWILLRLDSVMPAILLAVAAVPLTVMGGQAGILQGERRWRALALLYLAMGIPRLVIGTAFIAWRPTETSAMFGVMLAMFVPAVIGWWTLRRTRAVGETSDTHTAGLIGRETLKSSTALLAFFVLSNADIVVARNILDERQAGLYAAGLILTKAVLFLPQFVVVLAFPAMSSAELRRRILLRSLVATLGLGALCTIAAAVLSPVAMVFVGGNEYVEVESRLWLFAVLGTLLATLQLLVYSVLARQGTRSTYAVWLAIAVFLAAASQLSTITQLLVTITVIDAVLFATLLGLSLWRMRRAPDAQLADVR